MREPEIAIIDPNTLSCIGLQNLLSEIIPMATIRTFGSFAALIDDTPDMYAHYFVAVQIFFQNPAFFLARPLRTVVLCGKENVSMLSGVSSLDVSQDEKGLAKSILSLYRHGHGKVSSVVTANSNVIASELTAREIEVLSLVVKGLINKEIADKLNIGLTTVITHRKNISAKLGIKSVSGLAIYAVMHGYVEVDSI